MTDRNEYFAEFDEALNLNSDVRDDTAESEGTEVVETSSDRTARTGVIASIVLAGAAGLAGAFAWLMPPQNSYDRQARSALDDAASDVSKKLDDAARKSAEANASAARANQATAASNQAMNEQIKTLFATTVKTVEVSETFVSEMKEMEAVLRLRPIGNYTYNIYEDVKTGLKVYEVTDANGNKTGDKISLGKGNPFLISDKKVLYEILKVNNPKLSEEELQGVSTLIFETLEEERAGKALTAKEADAMLTAKLNSVEAKWFASQDGNRFTGCTPTTTIDSVGCATTTMTRRSKNYCYDDNSYASNGSGLYNNNDFYNAILELSRLYYLDRADARRVYGGYGYGYRRGYYRDYYGNGPRVVVINNYYGKGGRPGPGPKPDPTPSGSWTNDKNTVGTTSYTNYAGYTTSSGTPVMNALPRGNRGSATGTSGSRGNNNGGNGGGSVIGGTTGPIVLQRAEQKTQDLNEMDVFGAKSGTSSVIRSDSKGSSILSPRAKEVVQQKASDITPAGSSVVADKRGMRQRDLQPEQPAKTGGINSQTMDAVNQAKARADKRQTRDAGTVAKGGDLLPGGREDRRVTRDARTGGGVSQGTHDAVQAAVRREQARIDNAPTKNNQGDIYDAPDRSRRTRTRDNDFIAPPSGGQAAPVRNDRNPHIVRDRAPAPVKETRVKETRVRTTPPRVERIDEEEMPRVKTFTNRGIKKNYTSGGKRQKSGAINGGGSKPRIERRTTRGR